ncbi:Uncharacterised protein [Nocardia otitidiscaviarum]|uniref:Uncharacterized protein n=1 Tax=Nocardia otitidiscaviarum TaxID=1823 RepID=A0A379JKC0_9NOCA|nr:hypothetical protein [Nocardia otitidiscaviarum]SUD48938.1 Uncharacterised protein [Nocardia otitidiscaviarum]
MAPQRAHSYLLAFLATLAGLAALGITPIALLALTLAAAAVALTAALLPPHSAPDPTTRQDPPSNRRSHVSAGSWPDPA